MPADQRKLIRAEVNRLSADPHGSQPQVKPLKGRFTGMFRLRVGDWRVLFQADRAAAVLGVGPIAARRRLR